MSEPQQDRSCGNHGAETRQTGANGISGPERTAVYRLYDAEGALLYIGATGNPDARFGQHSVSKPWWPQVVRRDIEWFDSRPEAFIAEGKAIYSEAPRHNLTNRPSQAKGRKVSLWLPDDVAAQWKATGLPLAELIRLGLEAPEPEPPLTAGSLSQIIRETLADRLDAKPDAERFGRIFREELEYLTPEQRAAIFGR